MLKSNVSTEVSKIFKIIKELNNIQCYHDIYCIVKTLNIEHSIIPQKHSPCCILVTLDIVSFLDDFEYLANFR